MEPENENNKRATIWILIELIVVGTFYFSFVERLKKKSKCLAHINLKLLANYFFVHMRTF